jgi:hypothetical protein
MGRRELKNGRLSHNRIASHFEGQLNVLVPWKKLSIGSSDKSRGSLAEKRRDRTKGKWLP